MTRQKNIISLVLLLVLALTPVTARWVTYQVWGCESEEACSEPLQLAWMNPAILGAGGVSGEAGIATGYYTSRPDNADSWGSTTIGTSDYLNGAVIKGLDGQSGDGVVDSIGFYHGGAGSPAPTICAVYLYQQNGSEWDRKGGGTVSFTDDTVWDNITGLSISINTSNVYAVFYECDGTFTQRYQIITGGQGYYKTNAYSNPLPDPLNYLGGGGTDTVGVRIHVQ